MARMKRHGVRSTAVALVLASAVAACDDECERGRLPESQAGRVSIGEGIWGETWYWDDAYPLPNGTGCEANPTVTPVARTVLVYREVTQQEFDRADLEVPGAGYIDQASFDERLGTSVIDSVDSDVQGFFQASLPPGTYSIFVREGPWLYAPSVPITVRVYALSKTHVQFDIIAESGRPGGGP